MIRSSRCYSEGEAQREVQGGQVAAQARVSAPVRLATRVAENRKPKHTLLFVFLFLFVFARSLDFGLCFPTDSDGALGNHPRRRGVLELKTVTCREAKYRIGSTEIVSFCY